MPLNKTKLAGRKKGYQRPTTKEELKSREMMRIALRSIGGVK